MKNFIKTMSGCIFTVEEYKENMIAQLENNFDGETFDSVRAVEQYAEELWDYDEVETVDENGEKVSEEEISFEFVSEYDSARADYIKAALRVAIVCIEITADNFIEVQDECEEIVDNSRFFRFLDYVSDRQLVKIADTSGDYEFDDVNGIAGEIISRVGKEFNEDLQYDEYGEFIYGAWQTFYDDCVEQLRKECKFC